MAIIKGGFPTSLPITFSIAIMTYEDIEKVLLYDTMFGITSYCRCMGVIKDTSCAVM